MEHTAEIIWIVLIGNLEAKSIVVGALFLAMFSFDMI
jgi:hypothetical protein